MPFLSAWSAARAGSGLRIELVALMQCLAHETHKSIGTGADRGAFGFVVWPGLEADLARATRCNVGLASPEAGCLLEGVGELEHFEIGVMATHDLQAHGKTVGGEPAWHRHRR